MAYTIDPDAEVHACDTCLHFRSDATLDEMEEGLICSKGHQARLYIPRFPHFIGERTHWRRRCADFELDEESRYA